MVLPIYNVLIKIDPNVLNAARDLGANPAQTFVKVTLPLSIPGVISGITMVFVPALTTFVISDLLGGGKILLIGNVIEQSFKQNSNWHVEADCLLCLWCLLLPVWPLWRNMTRRKEARLFDQKIYSENLPGAYFPFAVRPYRYADRTVFQSVENKSEMGRLYPEMVSGAF